MTRPTGLRVAVGGRVISAATICPDDGAALLAGRDEDLVQHAAVEGHDVAAEAAVVLVAAHDALGGPLEDPDDAALGPLRACRSTRATTRSPCRASRMFAAATKRSAWPSRARLRHDEAVPGGVAREPAHDEVHAVGQADPRAADVDERAVGDEPAKDRLQLPPSGERRGRAGARARARKSACRGPTRGRAPGVRGWLRCLWKIRYGAGAGGGT